MISHEILILNSKELKKYLKELYITIELNEEENQFKIEYIKSNIQF